MTQLKSPTRPSKTGDLLSPDFMRQLDRLDVQSRKMLRGSQQGERRTKKKGQSVEFADYRSYVVGDDLRFVDWNLYARLDKLFIRLFMEEEDLSVSVVIDTSGSMDYGQPNKLDYAKKLSAALGYISLTHYNRTSLYSMADGVIESAEGMRGRRPIPRLLEFLNRQQAMPPDAKRPGDMTTTFKKLAVSNQRPGVVIVISDFWDKGDLADAFRYLAGDKWDVYLIHLLSPEEVDPLKGKVVGDLRLTDLEDGDVAEVSVSPALIKKYQATLQAYCNHIKDQARRRGLAYMVSETDVPFETMVLKYLRQRGLLA
ncbi:MAG: DUF58 domain-containing protein [Planctomycetota bacterium]